jgi:hypothetical protein
MLYLKKIRVLTVIFAMFVVFVPYCVAKSAKSSEVIVRRVDSNQLIRLRVFIDGKSVGALSVGQTSVYKVANGYHTMRVGFEDFQQRGTEVAQFRSYNSTHVFSVTDNSVVLVSEETMTEPSVAPTPISPTGGLAFNPGDRSMGAESSMGLDNAIRSAFDKATKNLKAKKKLAIINVDADNAGEGNFVLEELTLLSVNSPKNLVVIDRRRVDAYRAVNSIGIPSYDNDHMLQFIGQLMAVDYVLSGVLDGPGDLRRLRVKTLDVATGNLIGDSSERL